MCNINNISKLYYQLRTIKAEYTLMKYYWNNECKVIGEEIRGRTINKSESEHSESWSDWTEWSMWSSCRYSRGKYITSRWRRCRKEDFKRRYFQRISCNS